MRKLLISVLLASLAFTAFADDAKVLPSGVLRLTFANSVVSADSFYNEDGEKKDSPNFETLMLDNLGAAIEFGVNDIISAAIQWAPGTMAYGNIESKGIELGLASVGSSGDSSNIKFGGLSDLFIGAKIQAVNTNDIRFCFAPGLAVPLDKYDPVVEGKAIAKGDDFRIMSQSETESLGLGLRLYFDYQISKSFYINVYNQTRYYFSNKKYDTSDAFTYAGMYNGVSEAYADANIEAEKQEYEYPVYLDFELEPHFDLTLNKSATMGFSVPVDFSMNSKEKVDNKDVDNTDSYSLSVNPGLSFFYTGAVPFELCANYDYPLMGKNVNYATSVFTVKLKLFYDFY